MEKFIAAPKWAVPEDDTILEDLPPEARKQGRPYIGFQTRPEESLRDSPIRAKRPSRSKASYKSHSSQQIQGEDDNEDDDDGTYQESPINPTHHSNQSQRNRGSGRGHSRGQGSRGGNSTGVVSHRATNPNRAAYCTHTCLLGLARNLALDPSCPNYHLHIRPVKSSLRRNGRYGAKSSILGTQQAVAARPSTHHILTLSDFLRFLKCQMDRTLDVGFEDLRLEGSRGRLFKITLLSYGYSFVAKATRTCFIPALVHEASIYAQLAPLQGIHIPVYLGNINLEFPYLDFGLKLPHFMLLSHAGTQLNMLCGLVECYEKGFHQRMWEVARRIEELGVVHGDLVEMGELRWPNMLWDQREGKVMLCDFERSKMVEEDEGGKKTREPLESIIEEDQEAAAGERDREGSRNGRREDGGVEMFVDDEWKCGRDVMS